MAKILIIEDDIGVIENLYQIFKLNNYEVFTAQNGRLGVEQAMKFMPDIIVCDIMMPEMDGYQVLKTLRSEPSTFGIPFLFLTAKAEKADQRYGMELGADDYITKPFGNSEIINAVESRLTKHQQVKVFYEAKLDDLRQTITSAIPHELRTPLNSILGFAQMLRKNYKNLNENDIHHMLDNIYESGERLLRLVLNYTFFTSLIDIPTDGSYRPFKTVAHSEFEIVQQAQSTSFEYKRDTDLIISTEDAPVSLYREHLIKVVEELIDNAFKFSDTETEVLISSKIKENFLELSVSNYGRGMTHEQISNIGAFTQFDRKDYEQQGSGMGLTIVAKLMEIYGGDLHIESEQDYKTIVTLKLPITK
jgi:two-component system, sensor histidine kinase and response regulator